MHEKREESKKEARRTRGGRFGEEVTREKGILKVSTIVVS